MIAMFGTCVVLTYLIASTCCLDVSDFFMDVKIVNGKLDGSTASMTLNNTVEFVVHYPESNVSCTYKYTILWIKKRSSRKILEHVQTESY